MFKTVLAVKPSHYCSPSIATRKRILQFVVLCSLLLLLFVLPTDSLSFYNININHYNNKNIIIPRLSSSLQHQSTTDRRLVLSSSHFTSSVVSLYASREGHNYECNNNEADDSIIVSNGKTKTTTATISTKTSSFFRNTILCMFIVVSIFQLPSLSLLPPVANAIQPKNEALCNTGFFTNIGQWYCTDIGNISDEGISKGLSSNQEDVTDSLLSKFDLTTTSITTTESDKSSSSDSNNGDTSISADATSTSSTKQ